MAKILQFPIKTSERPQFLGLSPDQMSRLLHSPFVNGEFLTISADADSAFKVVPLIQQALFMLEEAQKNAGFKLTRLENLPRAFVKDFWRRFQEEERYSLEPNNEDDCLPAMRCHTALKLSGLLRKYKGRLVVTQKGLAHLKAGPNHELYVQLFTAIMNQWNWACGDRFDELRIIQMSGLFNLYALSKIKNENPLTEKRATEVFLAAFPTAVTEVTAPFINPLEDIQRSYKVRFLERICQPLGLIQLNDKGVITPTPLFESCFHFR